MSTTRIVQMNANRRREASRRPSRIASAALVVLSLGVGCSDEGEEEEAEEQASVPTAIAAYSMVPGSQVCREFVTEFRGQSGQEDLLAAEVEEEYGVARFMGDLDDLRLGKRCSEIFSQEPSAACHYEQRWGGRDLPRGVSARYQSNVMYVYGDNAVGEMMDACVESDGRYERL